VEILNSVIAREIATVEDPYRLGLACVYVHVAISHKFRE